MGGLRSPLMHTLGAQCHPFQLQTKGGLWSLTRILPLTSTSNKFWFSLNISKMHWGPRLCALAYFWPEPQLLLSSSLGRLPAAAGHCQRPLGPFLLTTVKQSQPSPPRFPLSWGTEGLSRAVRCSLSSPTPVPQLRGPVNSWAPT